MGQGIYKMPFGVMFHHFFDETHPRGQGSISSEELEIILMWLQKSFTILPPEEFLFKKNNKTIRNDEICLTFDDSLLCQFDIAIPVLESLGLRAFFNVYSSVFFGNPDPLEIYRYFRTVAFSSIDDFYKTFFYFLKEHECNLHKEAKNKFAITTDYLGNFPFYSTEDRFFRFTRDRVLGRDKYIEIMNSLMDEMNFDTLVIPEKVFMKRENLIELNSNGHQLGLHSNTHPTDFASLNLVEQAKEYSDNLNFFISEIGVNPVSMAHPCGSYNLDTIEVLNNLKMEIGFGSNMNTNTFGTKFEVPREDHIAILKLARK